MQSRVTVVPTEPALMPGPLTIIGTRMPPCQTHHLAEIVRFAKMRSIHWRNWLDTMRNLFNEHADVTRDDKDEE